MSFILVSKGLKVKDIVAGCHGDIHYTLFNVAVTQDDENSEDEDLGCHGLKGSIQKHGPPRGKKKNARHVRGKQKKAACKHLRQDCEPSLLHNCTLLPPNYMASDDKPGGIGEFASTNTASRLIPLGFIIMSLLLISLLMIPTVEAHLGETYAGYDLINRPTLVDTGNRVILLKDIYLKRGHILSFHAIFDLSLLVPTYFQIWRRIWTPENVERHVLVVERRCENMTQNYTMDVEADNIRIEEGDRLGVMVISDKYAPIHASQTPKMTGTIFHKLHDPNVLPQLNDNNGIEFDGLEFPYTFSIGVTYEPDEHTEGVYIGEQGDTGATGPQGLPGEVGATGYTGATGATGSRGEKGEKGNKGEQGETGLQGPTGPIGDTGATGRMGATGATGPPGNIGVTGEKGDRGSIGATGMTGYTGPPGATGSTGATGLAGELGATGHTGNMGATGATGPQGPVGATGDAGMRGEKGEIGIRGEKGQKGDRGPTGQPGPDINIMLGDVCSSNVSICEGKCVVDIMAENHFHCECKPGYEVSSDGHSCQDVDECALRNGGCQITCVNTVGSYQCACANGLKLAQDGHSCIDILECDIDNGNCESDELCLDLYSSHVCIRSLEDNQNYFVTDEEDANSAKVLAAKDDENKLVKDEVIIGVIIWMGVMTLILLIIIVVLCCQKRRMHREKKLYRHYAEAMRRASQPQQPPSQPAAHGSYLGSDLPEHTYAHY